MGDFTVCSFENIEDDFQWAFAGVNSSNVDSEKRFVGRIGKNS